MASPVTSPVEVVERAPGLAVTTVVIDVGQQVFSGHYPGFPIFPGVCVVECVHQGALAAPPFTGAEIGLAAVESTRFQSPVFPGDIVTSELEWSAAGAAWQCQAQVHTARGRVAQVRLRYEIRES
jgi:3-hydroxyacyl-[acyl-carrier-protein] dehydratase